MSLLCHECGRDIEFGEPLHSVTTPEAASHAAVCKDCLRNCTELLTDANADVPGLCLHRSYSSENSNGSYTISRFTIGPKEAVVPAAVAKAYLPRCSRDYLPEEQK